MKPEAGDRCVTTLCTSSVTAGAAALIPAPSGLTPTTPALAAAIFSPPAAAGRCFLPLPLPLPLLPAGGEGTKRRDVAEPAGEGPGPTGRTEGQQGQ